MEKWVRRTMELEVGSRTKYLFSDKQQGRKEPGGLYEPYLYDKLQSTQTECVRLIPRHLEIETYVIGR